MSHTDLEALFVEVDREIDPRCEMLLYARHDMSDEDAIAYYFDSAEYPLRHLVANLENGGVDLQSLSALDFASGYGRFTRYFVKLFGEVTAADVDPQMMNFCASRFGCDTQLSEEGGLCAELAEPRFDLTWCFSLFTHLTRGHWEQWLAALWKNVAPGGRLVFSTHGYDLFELMDPKRFAGPENQQREFVFWGSNETGGRLDAAVYGTTIVTTAFVHRQADRLPEMAAIESFPMGAFDRYHNMHVLRRAG